MQSQSAPRACTLFFLPLLTLAFPLGVLLVVLQRLPAEDVRLASTDARLLQPVSTFWCSAQEVSSSHPFYAYKVPKAPSVLREPPHQHLLAFRFNLLHGTHYMLRYHLLQGSTLELAGCTNRHSAPFEVFYGKDDWNRCLAVLTKGKETHDHSSEEEDEEETDSSSEEEDSVRLARDTGNHIVASRFRYEPNLPREGCRRNQKLTCENSLMSGELYLALTDEEPSPACPVGQFPFAMTAAKTGKYYVVIRTDGVSEPGGVLLHVRLNRTSYELPESVLFCRSPNSCAIPLSFGAEERVVVFVSAEPDAGAALFQVRSKCQPRAAFYLVVFLLLPVLFALALLYLVRFQRRRRRRTAGHLAQARVEHTPPSLVVKEDNDLQVQGGSPPPYREVVRQPPKSPESTPPPSYEELLRQPLVSVHRC